jgi:hypothetical protein
VPPADEGGVLDEGASEAATSGRGVFAEAPPAGASGVLDDGTDVAAAGLGGAVASGRGVPAEAPPADASGVLDDGAGEASSGLSWASEGSLAAFTISCGNGAPPSSRAEPELSLIGGW